MITEVITSCQRTVFCLATTLLFVFFVMPASAQRWQWSWFSGDSVANSDGNYGQQGAYFELNSPPARDNVSRWRDTSGNLWLYGGRNFFDRNGFYFGDLWQYSILLHQWRWEQGSQQQNTGVIADSTGDNSPGAREAAATWVDSSNMLWLFGGYSFADNFFGNFFNDLWRFDISRGQWSRASASSVPNQLGHYGRMGVPDSMNIPAARELSVTWQDKQGNFWLFGGSTTLEQRFIFDLNDLWKYNVQSGVWTWMKGDSTTTITSVFGSKGVSAATNHPGAREASLSWTDANGNFWLYGGSQYKLDTVGEDIYQDLNLLNDLWKYTPATGEWTWMNGDSSFNQPTAHGLKGVGSSGNTPGGRDYAAAWTDSTGNLWLFGGEAYTENGGGSLNDVWKYDVKNNIWTWVDGENTADPNGIYGQKFQADSSHHPGGRTGSTIWSDGKRTTWLFGGNGISSLDHGFLNDLWEYRDTAQLQVPVTVKIDNPVSNSVIPAGKLIVLDALASTESGASITKVEFFVQGALILTDSSAPYGLSSKDVEPGVFLLTAKATDSRGQTAISDTVKLTVSGCVPTGAITAEGFTNIPGTQVADLLANSAYPQNPSIVAQLPSMEYADVGTNYGGRLRGFICAPQTGNYVFSIAGDDQAGIFLSTDDDPAHAQLIAYNISPVGFRQFNVFGTQRSAPIRLLKGARYYIETLHKQSDGANFMTVSWILPDGSTETPIAANRLSPLASAPVANFVERMNVAQQSFLVTASPNPSTDRFEVRTMSKSADPVSMTVTDLLGRVIERREHVSPNSVVSLGERYSIGVYFILIRQGDRQERLKVVKH